MIAPREGGASRDAAMLARSCRTIETPGHLCFERLTFLHAAPAGVSPFVGFRSSDLDNSVEAYGLLNIIVRSREALAGDPSAPHSRLTPTNLGTY
jgi:hypothetical protein